MLAVVAVAFVLAAMAAVGFVSQLIYAAAGRKKVRSRRVASRRVASAHATPFYVPFAQIEAADALAVDCTHTSALTLTHHKGHNNPPGLAPADTSTGLVLNALEAWLSTTAAKPAQLDDWLGRPAVAVNHFDGDALFSAWAVIQRRKALQHAQVLRLAAALHDFREVPGLGSAPGDAADTALALCCWVNSVERARFSPPYDDKDSDDKFAFFLEELGPFLAAPQAYAKEWRGEHERVLADWRALEASKPASVQLHQEIGLAVVQAQRPVHYYALFSHTLGCDAVVSVYEGQCYEVEQKYTQFVMLWSRPVQARLDMAPLAAALNRLDTLREAGTQWCTPRLVDTGPLLRLDPGGQKLSKKERYGHPFARPMHRSGLSPAAFAGVVESYFRHGLQGMPPRVGGWSWEALHEVNAAIDWAAWEKGLPQVLSQLGAISQPPLQGWC